jgi:hypothetical protein
MRVLMDEQPLEVAEPTLAAALDAARRKAESLRRVVVEATVDGLVIPDEALSSPSQDRFDSSEVRFVTAEPVALVQTTMREVAELLSDTSVAQAKAAEHITAGELEPAMQQLSSALAAWDSVHQVIVNGAALLATSAEDMQVQPPGEDAPAIVGDRVRELASHLGAIKRTIAAQDWAGLSDTLTYDMSAQCDRWQALLKTLADELPRITRASGR